MRVTRSEKLRSSFLLKSELMIADAATDLGSLRAVRMIRSWNRRGQVAASQKSEVAIIT